MTEPEASAPHPPRPGRLFVEDASGRLPFMRGIMVHSLMARGVSFQEAYRVANAVRDELRPREVVSRDDLASAVDRHCDPGELREGPRPRPPAIHVLSESGRGTPFSKGFLSQSLLAAALEPSEAFDVAREIESELWRRGLAEVDRHELRQIAYETLHQRVGPEAAERYLVWRKWEGESERPVILLLGGTSGVGKTSLAQEVAHRLGTARVVSTDAIRQVMRIMLSREIMPAIHASSYDAWRVMPQLGSEDAVLEGFLAQATTVQVGVRAMMDRAVAETSNLVLDGVSIVPGGIDLAPYEGRAEVIFLLVATLDSEKFASRFEARGRASKARPPHRYLENLDAIERIQQHLLEQAELHDVPIVDNDSFDRSVLSIIRHVTETLRKRDKFDVASLF